VTTRSTQPEAPKNRYRWVNISLGFGAALAVLLLVNSIANYVFISRRIVVEQLRRDMSKQVVGFERQARENHDTNLAALIETLRKDPEKTLWVELRDRDERVVAHNGMNAAHVFSLEETRNRLRDREPLLKVVQTAAGEAVVEAFPIRIPDPSEHRSVPGLLEIASSTEGASSVFWPVRQNLIINCSAAVALLACLTMIAFRFKAYIQGKQLERQLEIASKVQQALLPAPERAPEQITVAAEFIPAQGVGGDFYDVFDAAPNRVAMLLGDVSGKGIPAALLMGVIHGAARSANWTESAKAHEQSTARLNRMLCERASSERFASMFWSYFDSESETLHYINAGHCAPLLLMERNDGRSVAALEEGGPVLGLLPNARYEQTAINTCAGDLLVMFSDGVVEAANEADEEFGEARIRFLLETAPAGITADQLHNDIMAAVHAFTGKAQPHDDLTLVVVRLEPSLADVRQERHMETQAA
jgi:hypothetical protein